MIGAFSISIRNISMVCTNFLKQLSIHWLKSKIDTLTQVILANFDTLTTIHNLVTIALLNLVCPVRINFWLICLISSLIIRHNQRIHQLIVDTEIFDRSNLELGSGII